MHSPMTTRPAPNWLDYRQFRGPGSISGEVRIAPGLYSPQLGRERDVLVYLPPSYGSDERRYPVLYLQDGQNLFDRATGFAGQEWEADETMERLSDEGIEAILVGIYHGEAHRFAEYNPFAHARNGEGERYLAFVTETVKPLVDGAFRTLAGREHTGIFGSSMGGLISLFGFFARPDIFGLVGAMSPALWVAGGAIYGTVRERPFAPGRIYLDNGTREMSARRMNAALIEKGYRPGHDLLYVAEANGEHTESAWARRLPDALRFLLGERPD